MKNSKLTLIIIALLLVGFFYKKSLEDRLKVVSHSAASTAQGAKNILNEINVVGFINSKSKTSEEIESFSEDFFLNEFIKINYSEEKSALLSSSIPDWKSDVGISSFRDYYKLSKQGHSLLPVFEVMLNEDYPKCDFDFNVVVKNNSKIKEFRELTGKSVAYARTGSAMIQSVLRQEKMKFGHSYAVSENRMGWIINAFEGGTVEAIVEISSNNGPYKFFRLLGIFEDKKFLKYDNYKIIFSKNIDIPCMLMFIDKDKMTTENQLHFTEVIKKAMLSKEPSYALYGLGRIYGVKEISPEKIEKMNKLLSFNLKKSLSTDYRDYTDEITLIDSSGMDKKTNP